MSGDPNFIPFDLARAEAFSTAQEEYLHGEDVRRNRANPRAITLGHWRDSEASPTATLMSLLRNHINVDGRYADVFKQLLDAIAEWNRPITIAPMTTEEEQGNG